MTIPLYPLTAIVKGLMSAEEVRCFFHFLKAISYTVHMQFCKLWLMHCKMGLHVYMIGSGYKIVAKE